MNPIKPIAITSGEPAGIGPDLCVQLAQKKRNYPVVVFSNTELLHQRAEQLKLELETTPYNENLAPEFSAGSLTVFDIPLATPVSTQTLDKKNAHHVIQLLSEAVQGCLNKNFSALVTGPVQKSIINEAGTSFSGHTEFFAELTNTPKVVMMLATKNLKVALVTTHLPLSKVPSAITRDNLESTIKILEKDLKVFFGIKNPRILVCGLNPHAGENGHLGNEELEIIIPTIEKLKVEGIKLSGPLPADTAFTPAYLNQADAILAMYHDQGLPVLKYQGFGSAANITLGLPFIRTSVDHGTALTLAGTGNADTGSMETAIHYAHLLSSNKSELSAL